MRELDPIPVTGDGGLRGRIVEIRRTLESETPLAVVEFDNGQQVRVPLDALAWKEDGTCHLAIDSSQLERHGRMDARQEAPLVLPVIEETLQVHKRVVDRGGVRIRTVVREHEETVDQPLLQEEVQIERVPVGRVLESPVGVREEGDTMIVPILEEVLVVEKRLMLKEELRITKRRSTVRQPQSVTLRKEEVTIERMGPEEGLPDGARDDAQEIADARKSAG